MAGIGRDGIKIVKMFWRNERKIVTLQQFFQTHLVSVLETLNLTIKI